MGRPREHDDATRAALLDEAERLIDEGGIDALSVRAVADGVGVSTRAIYSLFGSKEGLLAALATRSFELLGQWIGDLPVTADPAADLVEASVHVFRRYAVEHPALFALAFRGVVADLPLDSAYERAARRSFGLLEDRVQRLADAGGLGGWTVRHATVAFHSLTEGLAAVELRGVLIPEGAGEQMWRAAAAALVAGFGEGRPGGS
jgi:AcrR family transcriptional regulator